MNSLGGCNSWCTRAERRPSPQSSTRLPGSSIQRNCILTPSHATHCVRGCAVRHDHNDCPHHEWTSLVLHQAAGMVHVQCCIALYRTCFKFN
mmetsp:Transcript_66213/g.171788  ORF Transcript_66213/g.171788 Transcript_66213/m.171788 type:complete len:92 (-) Transcript_66213:64-339(-)